MPTIKFLLPGTDGMNFFEIFVGKRGVNDIHPAFDYRHNGIDPKKTGRESDIPLTVSWWECIGSSSHGK